MAAGVSIRPLLSAGEIIDGDRPAGLIVVGSHVPKTTAQWTRLKERFPHLVSVEWPVAKIMDGDDGFSVGQSAASVDRSLRSGKDVLVYTSRELVTKGDREASLEASRRVSRSLVDLVRGLSVPLRFCIAKGGITSSDLATDGMGVRRARVLGQILPGVPVWRLGEESKQPGLAYIVFPGNVGDDDALADAYEILRK